MCGICGAMSNYLSQGEIDAFRDLMVLSTLRGHQGSGVIKVGGKRHVDTLKYKGPAAAFAFDSRFDDFMKGQKSIVVGHARWPTKGDNSVQNLHPHRAKNIIGVHNGTMYEVGGESVKANESDSKKIFETIQEKGIREFVNTSKGAYALVWIDEDKKTLNFLRNDQRPLYFANVGYTNSVSTVYWASERMFLDYMLGKAYTSRAGTEINMIPADEHFVFPLNVGHNIRAIERVRMAQPLPPPVTHPPVKHGLVSRWRNGQWVEEEILPFEPDPKKGGGSEEKSGTTKPVSLGGNAELSWLERQRREQALKDAKLRRENALGDAAKNNQAIARLQNQIQGLPDRHNIHNLFPDSDQEMSEKDKEYFEKQVGTPEYLALKRFLDKGCAWCGETVQVGGKFVQVPPAEYVCEDCSNNPDVNMFLPQYADMKRTIN